MENENFSSLVEEWMPIQANILADLEYQRNLFEHIVATEMIYGRFKEIMEFTDIPEDCLEKWEALGYSILGIQHRIYHQIPDFAFRQKGQLLALSRNIVKEERFHNDAVLSKAEEMSDVEFLEELESKTMMIKKATLTRERVLKIVLVKPIPETLEHTATFLVCLAESHGVNLNMLKLYGPNDAIIVEDIQGSELFVKPL